LIKYSFKQSFQVLKVGSIFTNYEKVHRWKVISINRDTILLRCPTKDKAYKGNKAPIEKMYTFEIEDCTNPMYVLTREEWFIECL